MMGLLFYGGVMSLYWIAGLAGFVLVEKIFPNPFWVTRVIGAGLILMSAHMALRMI